MVYHTALSSFRRAVMVPVPSIWPETMCPPKRPFAAMARSKFTWLPTVRLPREERFRVSCITSAVKPPLSTVVAVRHTPLTATLSPTFRSDRISFAAMDSTDECCPRRTERMLPNSSTIPVNMVFYLALQQKVVP